MHIRTVDNWPQKNPCDYILVLKINYCLTVPSLSVPPDVTVEVLGQVIQNGRHVLINLHGQKIDKTESVIHINIQKTL